MKLVVALALLSNAAAFMAPVQPKAAMQPLKAITTEVRSSVRKRYAFVFLHSPGRRRRVPRHEESGAVPSPSTRDETITPSQHRP